MGCLSYNICSLVLKLNDSIIFWNNRDIYSDIEGEEEIYYTNTSDIKILKLMTFKGQGNHFFNTYNKKHLVACNDTEINIYLNFNTIGFNIPKPYTEIRPQHTIKNKFLGKITTDTDDLLLFYNNNILKRYTVSTVISNRIYFEISEIIRKKNKVDIITWYQTNYLSFLNIDSNRLENIGNYTSLILFPRKSELDMSEKILVNDFIRSNKKVLFLGGGSLINIKNGNLINNTR